VDLGLPLAHLLRHLPLAHLRRAVVCSAAHLVRHLLRHLPLAHLRRAVVCSAAHLVRHQLAADCLVPRLLLHLVR